VVVSRTQGGAELLDVGGVDLLAVSVGNTRTRVAPFAAGRLEESRPFDNADAAGLLGEIVRAYGCLPRGSAVVFASVNPPMAERLGEEAVAALGCPVGWIGDDVPVPIRYDLEPGTAVGQDRLLDAAAAHALVRGACVVVDAGTAITVDLVDGEGTFRGGAIAPGARMMAAALHSRTAQLPEVEPGKPARDAGRSTAEAIRSGVFHALRGLVVGLADAYGRELGGAPPVIATGGDAEWLFDDVSRVARIVPDLPLWGIALSWRAACARHAGRRA
jgi:type III pantothenate kinase